MANIAVFGLGYVGLANAVLLSAKNKVFAVDLDSDRVAKVNQRVSPISDPEIEYSLSNSELSLVATTSSKEALANADYAIIATPTDYDVDKDFFNTSSVESVLREINDTSRKTVVVIKSTIPIGFTERMQKLFPDLTIVFSPEFLREGKALYDNQFPSRIISSSRDETAARKFADLLGDSALDPAVPKLITRTTEAEAIKLFSNTYLAMRVAYFNEVDTYARTQGIDTKQIIDGVCLDPRIGSHYNNPSFGYGGYCLPKDTRQLLANYRNVPQTLISAVVESNILRKQFIADEVLAKKPSVVGVYRLTMKSGSDNFRSSSIQDVMSILHHNGVEILVYEPNLTGDDFGGFEVEKDLGKFLEDSDVIITNRLVPELIRGKDKVFTADLYSKD